MKKVTVSESSVRSFTSHYKREAAIALLKTVDPVIQKALTTPPDDLKRSVPHLLKGDYVQECLKRLYKTVGVHFARSIAKQIKAKKSDNWELFYSRYSNDRSKKITGQIMTTLEDNVNKTIDRVTGRMTEEGAGVVKIGKELQAELDSEFTDIMTWEAQRIAQTEVIGTANSASFESAKDAGIEGMLKAWVTRGDAKTRESHMSYQGEGSVEMDYEYNTGLQYPGDENCDLPEEIINCRCTVAYEFE